MKYIMLALLVALTTGCASTGDLEALSTRVDAIDATQKTLVSDVNAIKAEHSAITAEQTALKAEISSKLDNLFKKAQLK